MYNHITISIQEWNKQKQEINNVGSFGYDEGSDFFIVPCVCPGTFLSPVIPNYKIDNTEIKQGMFKKDQIVNIKGEMFQNNDRGIDFYDGTGCLFRSDTCNNCWTLYRCGGSVGNHKGFRFDASRVVQTGDRVMPRTIFQNLYVIVSEE